MSSDTHRVLELTSYDGASALSVKERPKPRLLRGEVLVKTLAAPVNPSDMMFIRGLYGIKKPLPAVPGFEGSGVVVEANGLGAKALVGRRVSFTTPKDADGTWAEFCVTKPSMCFPLRKAVPDEQGAMIIVNPLTAWAFLMMAKDGGHKAIVHTAAASALGRWLIPLARERKVKLVHVVRRGEQKKLLEGLGEEHVFDSSADGFDAALKAACKSTQATLAFDAVSGDTSGRVLSALPRGSTLCIYGALSEQAPAFNPGDFIFGDKRVRGMWLSTFFSTLNLPQMIRGALVVQRMIANGHATPIRETVSLEQLPGALARYGVAMTDGKILWRASL